MFWRGVLGYLPVNIVQAVAGFGAIVVFTRMLSPADYGAYALGFSVASLVSTCLFTWIEAAMARFYAAEAGGLDRAALYGTLYRTFAVMTLGVPAATLVVMVVLPLSPGLRLALAAGVGSVIARSLLKLAQERRRAAGEVRAFAVFDMVQTGGGFLLGCALAAMGLGGASPLVGAGAASALCLVFALPSELGHARRGRFDRARLGRYAAYGLPISLSLVMSLVLATTDRFVLAAYLNTGAVGAYHAGYSLSNRTLDVIFIWLGMAGGPASIMAFEAGGEALLAKVARSQAQLMALIAFPAAAGLALVAHPLADLMVGPELRTQAARVTPWIAAGALCSGLSTYYFNTAFTLARRTARLLLSLAIPMLANVALTLWLIPRHGLDGAMWATTASYALGLFAAVMLGRRCLRLPLPGASILRCAAATAVMALVIVQIPPWGGLAELVGKAAVGAITYVAAVLALDAGGARTRAGEGLAMLRRGRAVA